MAPKSKDLAKSQNIKGSVLAEPCSSASKEAKSKKKNVKFDTAGVNSKPSVLPDTNCKIKAVIEKVSDEHQENIGHRKRLRHRKSKTEKRQKLMDGVIGPAVDRMNYEAEETRKFSDFDLDERILKGVGELGWERPTQVQDSMIPLALEDKNIMARARTGSGKTAAFLLPILHKVLQHVSASPESHGPYALLIAPTKELATQVNKILVKLTNPLPFLQTLDLSELSENERCVWEKDNPAIVVSTPGKLLSMINIRPEFCRNVRHLVLDEADLLLSFGYENEMTKIKESLPVQYQCIFTSATLTDDMTFLKKIFMTGPVVTLKLKEGDLPDADQLAQYHITCLDDTERFAILIAMFKLRLIIGKTIIFVNSTDRCYMLSLVLRSFSLKSCILNSSMPANTRCHVIDQFNEGLFNIVIASDATDIVGEQKGEGGEQAPKKKNSRHDKESGVSRGIDFHHVGNVVNFDFPTTTDSYIHRVGRTARGWNKGTALSFCTPEERKYLDTIQEDINKQMNQKVLMPYEIRIKELDTFVLRTRDALHKCTKGTIKAARMKELKLEIMRSAKLQAFFANNPRERDLLETNTHPISLKLHSTAIGDVPEYMVPKALRGIDFSSGGKRKSKLGQKHRRRIKQSFNQKKHKRMQKDPLRSYKA